MEDISLMIGDAKLNYRVGACIKYNDNVLLEYSPNAKHAVLPGGRVKILEDSKSALKRELNEEMHFDVSLDNMDFSCLIENFFEAGCKFHELYYIYKINIDEKMYNEIDLVNHDSDGNYYRWVNAEAIDDEFILPEVTKNIVKGSNLIHYIVHE